MMTDVIEDNNKIVGSTIGGDFQRQDLVTETDLSEEMNRLGETTGRFQVQSLWTRRTHFEELSKLLPMWKFPTLENKLPFKKKTTKNCNVIRVCSPNTIKCLNAETILHGNRCFGLIDSGSSITLLSCSAYEKLDKP